LSPRNLSSETSPSGGTTIWFTLPAEA
jgi:hypothetical protein